MNFPDLQLTDYGTAAIMAAVYGSGDLIFTGVRLGDGTLPANADVKAMSDLRSQKAAVNISNITVANKVATITFALQLSQISSDFYLRELGIMCALEEGGTERLYAYTNAGTDAIMVKKDTSGNHVNINFTVHVTVGDAENVTAVISGVTGYVTQEAFEEHVNTRNPHGLEKEDIGLGNVPNAAPSDMTVTFEVSESVLQIETGSTLSELMSRIAAAIEALMSHLRANNNPHGVEPEQIGAAEEDHKHSASDITSGTLPISRGGTGCTTLAELKRTIGASSDAFYAVTMSASKWSSKVYSFAKTYPNAKYHIEVAIANTATQAQQDAFILARMAGSATENTITALGIVPTVDIPIILRVTEVA